MKKHICIFICLLFVSLVFADGTDVMDNYIAGTKAGANLETDTTGFRASGNTFVGATAGYANTTGSANVGIGYGALRAVTTGIGNIGLGYMAGQDATTGNHGLFIHNGYYPTNGIFGSFSSGYFGINNTSPAVALDVTGAITGSGILTGATYSSSANGTAAAPIIYRSTDTDTGLYWLANTGNRIGLTAKGAAVTIADSAGLMIVTAASVRLSPTSDLTDSSLTITLSSGVPAINIFGTDDDTYSITINTDDEAVFSGATGIDAGGAYLKNVLQKVQYVLADSTLTAATSGYLYIARPLAAKAAVILPSAAAGLFYDFMVADADTLRLVAASGDSLINSAGVASQSAGSVAGTIRLIAVDAVRWIMMNAIGTWTQDSGVL